MKKRKKQKILFRLLCFACVLFLFLLPVYALNTQTRAVPENPIHGIHPKRSMKGYLGKGYALGESEQEKETGEELLEDSVQELPEEPQEEAQTEPEETKPKADPDTEEVQAETSEEQPEDQEEPTEVKFEEPSPQPEPEEPSDDDDSQQDAVVPQQEEPQPEVDPEEGKYPQVASDLTDGETVNDTYRVFYVQALDYMGQILSASELEVTGNGEKLYSVSDTGEMTAYRLELLEGANEISIKATDGEGRSTTVSYTIYRGEELQPQIAGNIQFSLEAGTLGLGYLIAPVSVPFYQGEQLSYVLDRVITENGYLYSYDGSLDSGFYLKSIISGGITQGYEIPEELLDHLADVNCPIEDWHWDQLGEFDFTRESGWLYFVNGEYMNSGISAYFPADGDVIRMRFSLYGGADVGAGQNGQTWGDW